MTSPLLQLPGAVAGEGVDAPVAAHYGSFNHEQRSLVAGDGFVDLSHRDVVRVAGPERLALLHAVTTQYFEGLPPHQWTGALVLSPQGRVEHAFFGYDDPGAAEGEGTFTAHTEPGTAAALVEFLESMKFMMRVETSDVTATLATTWRPGRDPEPAAVSEADPHGPGAPTRSPYQPYEFVERDRLEEYAAAAGPACGLWAFEALRIARWEPRFGIDTDDRTIPNEVGWIGPAVHLEKGCYRGQETVARVHTLGKPPRRLTMLHLDGSENRLPEQGSSVMRGEKAVGFVGSSARHHELGPIALALLKRNVPTDEELLTDEVPAAQEVVVDPEVGLHVRPKLQ